MKIKYSLCFLSLLFFTSDAFSQIQKTFSVDYQVTQKGGIVFLSNVAVGCAADPVTAGGACQTGTAEIPPAGTYRDNNFNGQYIDIDGDTSTFMSSSDSLVLSTCSEITWAGIYWSANGSTATAGYNTIKIKANNGTYQSVVADSSWAYTTGFNTYHCYTNITSFVQNAGVNARFTVADIPFTNQGATNEFGSWLIVVVYKNDLMGMRQLTVFDGRANIAGSDSVDIPITGFLTPLTGPVTLEFGIYVHDGDRSSTGDRLSFNGAGSFVGIADAINPANDIMNSTVSRNGILTPYRTPDLNNTAGLDADIFYPDNTAKNYIGNSATSGTFRMTTGGETYLPQVITTAIDVYEPDVRATVTAVDINGGLAEPGDTILYTVVGKNIGSDPSINTYILDSIEINANYVPNSITVTAGPNSGNKTDVTGDDQAEYNAAARAIVVRIGTGANATSGGQVNDSPTGIDSTEFKFLAVATTNCVMLLCDNNIDNRAYIFGTGNISGNTYNNSSSPGFFDINGCPINGLTSTTINISGCSTPADTSISTCAGTPFSSLYPLSGYIYYDAGFSVVTAPVTIGTHYAINIAYPGCGDTITITITSVSNCDNDNDGISDATDLDDDNDGILDVDETSVPLQDTDNDGLVDAFDSDSDNDGCADAVEAGHIDTDGDGYLGLSPVVVDANGLVINQGGYTGTTADVTDSTQTASACNGPAQGNETTAINEDNSLTNFDIDNNNTDPDGDTLTVVFTGSTSGGTGTNGGTFTNNGNGTINYSPLPDFSGNDTLFYSVCDNAVLPNCVTDTLIVIVNPVNDIPVIDNETNTIQEDGGPATGDLTDTGDSDVDGNLVVNTTPLSGPSNGNITVNSNGTYSYTPNPDFNGTDTVVIQICDDGTPLPAICVNDTIYIIVTPVNDIPVIDNETNTIQEDGGPATGDLTDAGDSDVDGNLVVNTAPLSGPSNGNITVNSNGTYSYTPNPDFNGTDTVVIQICDDGTPLPANCINDTIFITVTPALTDTDGDGIPDITDIDDDNDGIPDITESLTASNGGDTDGDGIPDVLDLDSDNDGIADVTEAGGSDSDNDGIIGSGPITDADNDGLSDLVDDVNSSGLTPPDFDGDGHPDFQDLDSDNDAMSDLDESGGNQQDANSDGVVDGPDTDGDGLMDSVDADQNGTLTANPLDSDNDGLPDYTDLDSDNDGINDIVETGNEALDSNSDGVADGGDADNDGITDSADSNDSQYGDPDSNDIATDTDSDGVPNYADLDSDNDGTDDIVEAGFTALDVNQDGIVDGGDNDNDGIIDAADANDGVYGDADLNDTPSDTDGDGVYDYIDLDSDNDGIDDVVEAGFGNLDTNNDGIIDGGDADNDGILDPVDGADGTFGDGPNGSTTLDTDNDGICNTQDLDSDNDGINDIDEAGLGNLDNNNDGTVDGTDTDNDGILDPVDGANGVFGDGPNGAVDPVDTDGDGLPNYLDLDSDGDNVNDGNITMEETADADCDNDGISNYLDPDPCMLFIPEGFSPNDDGVHDVLVIRGSNTYPAHTFTIFNRWGNKVFEASPYLDNWKGTNEFGISIGGEELPAGTYFYIFETGEEGKNPVKGYIYLNR